MKTTVNSSKEIERLFLISVKVTLDTSSIELDTNTRMELEEELTEELVQVYSELNYHGKTYRVIEDSFDGDVYEVVFDKQSRLLIHKHETGPEVFLIPIAYFLGSAIVSGVISNLAYDVLKKLHSNSNDALKRCIQRRNNYHKKTNENRLEKELQTKLEIRLYTPEGTIRVKFYRDKGLPPELANLLIKRISQYQKKNLVQHILKRFLNI